MKRLLLIATLFATSYVAQAQEEENPNIKAQKEMAKKGYFGFFEYKADEVHSINVNYAIEPKVPSSEVTVMLHTPHDNPLTMIVTTPQGKKVAEMSLSRDEYIKEGKVDVSGLKAGKYVYVIQWDGESVYEIPFEKK